MNIFPSPRSKLGLALAGGGFRASFFHLGVLYRLADLDVLRRVEALSTVSGGSIIGALYMLILNRELTKKHTLDQKDYVAIVREVDDRLTMAVQENLRLQLFMNPLRVYRIFFREKTMAEAMADLYDKFLFRDVTGENTEQGTQQPTIPKSPLMKDIRPHLPDRQSTAEYNRMALESDESVLTEIFINATTLNSGGRFWFSSYEIGDWYLGHVRIDEAKEIVEVKNQLESKSPASTDLVSQSFIKWFKDQAPGKAANANLPLEYQALFSIPGGLPGKLLEIEPGKLRKLKISAWRMLKRLPSEKRGGLSPEFLKFQFKEDLIKFDKKLYENIAKLIDWDAPGLHTEDVFKCLLMFVLELYYTRSAKRLKKSVETDVKKFTVAKAVGASACFPPVFPPLQEEHIFDDTIIHRLSLTDGGVFDNTGIRALLDENCTHIIASDTGAFFPFERTHSAGRFKMFLRMMQIWPKTILGLRRENLRQKKRAGDSTRLCPATPCVPSDLRVTKAAYFQISDTPPDIKDAHDWEYIIDRRRLSSVRTDLDAFGDIEISALVNCGYDSADRFVRDEFSGSFISKTLKDKNAPRTSRYWKAPVRNQIPRREICDQIDDIEESCSLGTVLDASAFTFFKALRLKCRRTQLVYGLIIAFLGATPWLLPPVFTEMRVWVRTVVQFVTDALPQPFVALFFTVHGWISSSISWIGNQLSILPITTLIAAFLLFWIFLLKKKPASKLNFGGLGKNLDKTRNDKKRNQARRSDKLRKFFRFLPWLILALPIFVVAVVAIVANVAYKVDTKTFLKKLSLSKAS